jgi:hypothetical protein
MRSLTIEAVSADSAQGFRSALSEFETELVETEDGRYLVKVALTGSDRAIVLVLHALEDYLTRRGDGPAKLRLEGTEYTMRPRPE